MHIFKPQTLLNIKNKFEDTGQIIKYSCIYFGNKLYYHGTELCYEGCSVFSRKVARYGLTIIGFFYWVLFYVRSSDF